jgi:hypothetical protein
MGGSSSKTTISDTANLLSSATMSSVVTCIATDSNSNNINVTGNDNIIKNISQSDKFTFKTNCLNDTSNENNMIQRLNNNTASSQAAEQQALAGFLDASTQSISDKIATNVLNTITISTANTCMTQVTSNNNFNVNGNQNVADGIKQTSDIDVLESCLLQAAQQNDTATTITNISNMAQSYKSDSLFEPFTSAFQNIAEAGMLGIFIIIFIVACIIIAYKYVKLNKQPKSVYPNGSST